MKPPIMQDDPYADEILLDPYEFHERLRDAGPVVYLEKYGVYATGRHVIVSAALRDHESFISGRGVGLLDLQRQTPWRKPSQLIEADPPIHTQSRAVINAVITGPRVRELRPEFERVADQLIPGLVRAGKFDAISQLAQTFPLTVMARAIGIPEGDNEPLLSYAEHSFNSFGPHNERFTERTVPIARVHESVMAMCRRDELTEDGMGRAVLDAAARFDLPEDRGTMLVRSLISAGFATTAYAVGNAMHALATHPDQWAALRANPSLARAAFDEALRFETVVQAFARVTARPMNIDGYAVPPGAKVLLFLGAANRDPRKWGDDADRFNIQRKVRGHLSFGFGIHQCSGQPIARLEADVVLRRLAAEADSITPIGEPVRKLNNVLRGWSSLPLAARPA